MGFINKSHWRIWLWLQYFIFLGNPESRPGCNAWGGGDGTIIYCAGVALSDINEGVIEETFLHEGAHVNLDSEIYNLTEWKCARDSDKHYISTYAKEHPLRLVNNDFFFQSKKGVPD